MIARVLAGRSRLDGWRHARLGRPYGIVLTVGLVIEIIHRLGEAPDRITEVRRLAAVVLLIALNLALLIRQLAELGERFDERAEREPSPHS